MSSTSTGSPADAGTVTELVPRTLDTATVGDDGTDEWMSKRYGLAAERFVRLNMITTLTGATSGADGTSETITSRTDRYVLGAIRRSADVVLVGAETRSRGGLPAAQDGAARDRHRDGRSGRGQPQRRWQGGSSAGARAVPAGDGRRGPTRDRRCARRGAGDPVRQ